MSSSPNNTIFENEIALNLNGFHLSDSLDNLIYHNVVKNNNIPASDDSVDGNFWDFGYPTGGNFWGNWTLPDLMKGPNQNISGSDGIVDLPFVIDGDSRDDYPLTNPLDKVPPVISILDPQEGSVIGDKQPEISASFFDDSLINVSSVILKLDNVDVTSQVAISVSGLSHTPQNELTDGQHTLYIEVEDIPGNRATKTWTFSIDSQPPIISDALANGDGRTVIPSGTIIMISATLDDSQNGGSAIGGANYTIGPENWPGIPMDPSDGSFDSPLENVQREIDTTGWLEGYYAVYVNSWDEVPNYNYSTADVIEIVIDSTPPVSSMDNLSGYWFANSPLLIDANANDVITNVESVELWYRSSSDNSSWGSWILFGTRDASQWNWQFDFPDSDGYYEFYTKALDTASNSEIKTNADAICGYDASPPKADAGSDKQVLIDTEYRFDGTSSSDNVQIVNYTWTFWDAKTNTLYGPNPSYTFQFPHENLEVTLQVTDLAGNTGDDKIFIDVVSQAGPGRIWGRVTDINGTPIARAWVRLGNLPLYTVNWTNTTGYYSFDNLTYGNYEINVRKRGYLRDEAFDLLISEEVETIRIDFKLEKIPEEEPEICLPIYGMVTFILIIFFLYLFLKVRKAKKAGLDKDGGFDHDNLGHEKSLENAPKQSTEPEGPPEPPS